MQNQILLDFAQDFIDDIVNDAPEFFDFSKPIGCVFEREILELDPDMEVLKRELHKVGYDLKHEKKDWILSKVN